mmetsp:Transcript_84032/g.162155  ORF Transcript_84032/g.162155 Transcript_84032/m.162155 type:complete len:85 (-) Transcript_84032:359-613(-)
MDSLTGRGLGPVLQPLVFLEAPRLTADLCFVVVRDAVCVVVVLPADGHQRMPEDLRFETRIATNQCSRLDAPGAQSPGFVACSE